jgi:hypothetical protein
MHPRPDNETPKRLEPNTKNQATSCFKKIKKHKTPPDRFFAGNMPLINNQRHVIQKSTQVVN